MPFIRKIDAVASTRSCPSPARVEHQLQDRRLAGAAGAKKILVCPAPKTDVAQDQLVVERQVHLVEEHHRRVDFGQLDWQPEFGEALGAHQNKIDSNNRVTKKSTINTATDAATTALVVDRPTPCVPPDVRRPTWQPIVTMTMPRKNGLMMPM